MKTTRDERASTYASRLAGPHFPLSPSTAARADGGPLSSAISSARGWLLDEQDAAGFWCGELQGDTILESEYILLLAWLGQEQTEVARQAGAYLLQQQQPDGGWSQYPGGPPDVSISVKAYFALKLLGRSADEPAMQAARDCILQMGGADQVNSFTRFFLALLGQISFDQCPAVPPEAVLLPAWAPLSIYHVSAWSRTILVPLSLVWAHRPARPVEVERGIRELIVEPPETWQLPHCPGLQDDAGWSWRRIFQGLDRTLKVLEKSRLRPLRSWAVQKAERWMLERFEDSDGLGAIFPSIVWSRIALDCLGYDEQSEEVLACHRQLDDLTLRRRETVRLQPCASPVWDTALTIRALAATGNLDLASQRAADWLLSKEVRTKGDWSERVAAEPAGWFFEFHNAFYPDVDDTTMVMMGLRDLLELRMQQPENLQGPANEHLADACERGRRWVLAMQNRDGGWAAFDKDNDHEFLCHVPFADHNAMIDPSTPDITGRVLEALGQWGMQRSEPALQRGIRYLRETQESDGSWPGRWGVNHIYGTWQVIVGLRGVGVPVDDPAVLRGARWLTRQQQPSGAWGESPASYEDVEQRGRGPATASQTAWALLGLMAAGRSSSAAVRRGIDYLLEQQNEQGTWDEEAFTGTGFPRVFYLRYHLYPVYFPLLALGTYRTLQAAGKE